MVSYSIFLYKNPSQAALPLPSPFGEGNPEGEYLHVQASGFRDIKFPAVIFRPKKRSGIAVRVAEMSGTWQAKRPTTHNTRSIKNPTGDILPHYNIPKGHAIRSFPNQIFFLSHQETPQTGDKGFARSQLCILQFFFRWFRVAHVIFCRFFLLPSCHSYFFFSSALWSGAFSMFSPLIFPFSRPAFSHLR